MFTAPDLFGHFLLDNEYNHDDDTDDDIQEIDESLDDEESESEVPEANIPEQSRPKRRRRNNDGIIVCNITFKKVFSLCLCGN